MNLTVHLTRRGKLPSTLTCPECGGTMRRRFGGGVYKLPVYRCRGCGAITTLYPSKKQRARGVA